MAERSEEWIGVDLDGTLARYEGWKGADHIGAPVPAMLARVKEWRSNGIEVRIFTARIYPYMGVLRPDTAMPVPPGAPLRCRQAGPARSTTCVGCLNRTAASATAF